MGEETISQPVRECLIAAIANDLDASISNLGYPVGMGLSPHPDSCKRAAGMIIDRITDKALPLLAERSELVSDLLAELEWLATFADVRSKDDSKTFARVNRGALRNIATRCRAAIAKATAQ